MTKFKWGLLLISTILLGRITMAGSGAQVGASPPRLTNAGEAVDPPAQLAPSLAQTLGLTITKTISSRRPVDVVHVLDTSGSMAQDWGKATRIQAAKGALVSFNNILRPARGDQVGLVTFGPQTGITDTYSLCDVKYKENRLYKAIVQNNLTGDIDDVNARINKLVLHGPTPLGAGILAGTAVVGGANHNPGSMPVLIIASDGVANVRSNGRRMGYMSYESSWDPVTRQFNTAHCNYPAEMDAIDAAQTAKDQGIRVFAVALGVSEEEYFSGDEVMRRIASVPTARHYFTATSAAQLEQIYEQIANEARAVVPGDQITYTISYENNGAGALTGIVITDVLPANTRFVSATAGYMVNSDVVSWTINELATGANDILTLVAQVDNPLPTRTTYIVNEEYGMASANDDGVVGAPVSIAVRKLVEPFENWLSDDVVSYAVGATEPPRPILTSTLETPTSLAGQAEVPAAGAMLLLITGLFAVLGWMLTRASRTRA